MNNLKKILKAMDSEESMTYSAYDQLQADLEAAVREHLLDLEELVGCLRANAVATSIVDRQAVLEDDLRKLELFARLKS